MNNLQDLINKIKIIKNLRTQYFQQLEDLYYEKYNREWELDQIDDIKAQFDDIVETILEYEGDKEKLFSEAALFTVASREHIEDIKGTTITFDEEVLELLKSITCDVLNIKHSEDIVIDLILQSIKKKIIYDSKRTVTKLIGK